MTANAIDQKVVSMKFDNSQFESGVKTTMSSLDKLKEKLNFKDSSKSLDSLTKQTKSFDMSSMSNAAEQVSVKFSALQVAGVTALSNIVNAAVNAGKNIVSALTIDPITTGFQEYETQINAVQTILANTSSKGTTLKQVNKALDELNKYADMTIYNFTEMTKNIGTFTAAGVDLDTSVSAIKGIANLAAVSGSTSQQASTAMYQLSQAMAAGTVKLQDWNSVVNAGMGGQVFQDALKETARVHGVAIDQMIKDEGSFRETLSKGWLTTEILTETLSKFTGDLSKKQLKQMGYTKKQIKEIQEMGKTANDAATKVKTFTQLWDTLKEAAQSGWTQTWELIIGDFEEAKEFLTYLSDTFSAVINGMSDSRNSMLTKVLQNDSWSELKSQVQDSGVTLKDFKTQLKAVANEHGVDVKSMIKDAGSFKDSLTQGWMTTEIFSEALTNTVSSGKLSGKSIDELSNKQLKNAGYTKTQIKNLRELAKASTEAGSSVDTLVQSTGKMSGRDLIIETIKSAIESIKKTLEAVGKAWNNVFGDEDGSEGLYAIIKGVHDLVTNAEPTEEALNNLEQAFTGVFSALKTAGMFASGTFSFFMKLLKVIQTAFGLDIWGLLGRVGAAFNELYNWIIKDNAVMSVITNTGNEFMNSLENNIQGIKDWAASFSQLPECTELVRKIQSAFEQIGEAASKWAIGTWTAVTDLGSALKSLDQLTPETIWQAFSDFVDNIKSKISEFASSFSSLGDAADSFMVNLRDKFGNGQNFVVDWFYKIYEVLKKIKDAFAENFGFAELFVTLFGVISAVAIYKITTAIVNFALGLDKLMSALASVPENIGTMFKDFGKARLLEAKGKMIKNVAKSVLMLAAALFIISKIPEEDLLRSVTALGAIVVVLGILAVVVGKLGASEVAFSGGAAALLELGVSVSLLVVSLKILEGMDFTKALANTFILVILIAALVTAVTLMSKHVAQLSSGSAIFLSIGVSLVLMATSMKILSTIDGQGALTAIFTLGAIVTAMVVIMAMASKISAGSGIGLLAAASSLLVLVIAIKAIMLIDMNEVANKLSNFIFVFSLIAALFIASSFAGKYAIQGAASIVLVSIAMLGLVGALKLLSTMDQSDIDKSIEALDSMMLMIAALIAVSSVAGADAAKAGVMLLGVSVAMLALSACLVIISHIEPEGLDRALDAIEQLGLLLVALIGITKYANLGSDSYKTIVAIGVTLAALVAALTILSGLEPDRLQSSTDALMTVMLSYAVMISAIGNMKGMKTKKALKNMAVILGVTVALAAIVVAMSQLGNPDAALQNASALSLLLVAMAAALTVLSHSKGGDKATAKIIPMLAVVSGLAAILGVMSALDVQASIPSAVALSILLLALSGSLAILQNVKTVSGKAIAAVAALAIVMAALAVPLAVLDGLNVELSVSQAAALGVLVLALSAALIPLAVAGKFGAAAIIGVGSLAALIVAMTAVFEALGALMNNVEGFGDNLDAAIDVMGKLGEGVGSFLGGILAGAIVKGTSTLPQVGDNLSAFMKSAKPFLNGLKNIDPKAASAAESLANTVAKLTESEALGAAQTTFLGGSDDFSNFGEKLSSFGKAMKKFGKIMADCDTESVKKGAKAGEALSEMINSFPSTGLSMSTLIFGTKDPASFGDSLKTFAKAMVKFGKNAADINMEGLNNGVTAGKKLADMVNALPSTGTSISSLIFGSKDPANFAESMKTFAKGMTKFANNSADLNMDGLNLGVKAAKRLIETFNSLPTTGGLASFFTGDQSFLSISNQLSPFATSLVNFSNTAADINSDGINKFSSLMEGINKAASIDTGGIANFRAGLVDLSTADYSGLASSLDGISDESVNKIIAISSAVSTMASTASGSLSSAGTSMMSGFASSIESGSAKAVRAASSMISKVVAIIKVKTAVFKVLGLTLMKSFASGITGSTSLSSAISTSLNAAKAIAAAKASTFSSIGKSIAQGIADGINNNSSVVSSAASSIGTVALAAARNNLKVNSPSKVFRDVVGVAIPEGVAAGIYKASKLVKMAIAGLSDETVDDALICLSSINGVSLFDDLDSSPTITPVLDLSEIQSGISDMNAIIANRTMSISTGMNGIAGARVASISGMMNGRVATTNKDVVDAISELQKGISGVGTNSNTYNINGITYDDGSNISSAVGQLIQAARIERRA